MVEKKAAPKRTPQNFLRVLERGIRDVLKEKDTSAADRLKAIEVGAKVAAIQHKINTGDEDAFFG